MGERSALWAIRWTLVLVVACSIARHALSYAAHAEPPAARQYAAALLAKGHLFEVGWMAVCHLRDEREAFRRDAGVDGEGDAHIDLMVSKLAGRLRELTGKRPSPRCDGPAFHATACPEPCDDERVRLVREAEAVALRALRGESLERLLAGQRAKLSKAHRAEGEALAEQAAQLMLGDAGR